jgi:hypothetical protein
VRFAYYENLSRREKAVYDQSDRLKALRLEEPGRFNPLVASVRSALEGGKLEEVRRSTAELLDELCAEFKVPRLKLQVLSVRPVNAESELHGLYTLEPGRRPLIQVWMRTARFARVVAFRTFVRTVLHEFLHHLDFTGLGMEWSFHTQGFFQRESSLMKQLAPPPAPKKTEPQGGAGLQGRD